MAPDPCVYLRTLRANRPCGRSIRMPTTASSVMTLAIEPDRKNSSVDWVCEMLKAEAMGPSRLGGPPAPPTREGVDGVKRPGGRPCRADHGEGAARDPGDAAAEA